MPEVIITVDIDSRLAEEYFRYAGYKIRDMREPLRAVMHDVILPGIQEQLDTEGSRTGGWEELSEDYRERKELTYPGMPILERTGKMREDLLDEFSWRVTRDSLRYQPFSDYAHWHQSGGYVAGRPPQRQIVTLTVQDEEQIEGIFQVWLDELRVANARRGGIDETYAPSIPFFDILGE